MTTVFMIQVCYKEELKGLVIWMYPSLAEFIHLIFLLLLFSVLLVGFL